ncbi:Ribulose-phosphate 3-epimerase [Dissostichus eleginoides]|uniref:Ribulose-phosphate 3-epimerase n=1 Tax=Dissostichus eleginoides TaxID=100907 RepID=A0AAD9BK72_DISEL|nr:Ribulose-phosphate 3-epimerase [Dissostichus eleginoides]
MRVSLSQTLRPLQRPGRWRPSLRSDRRVTRSLRAVPCPRVQRTAALQRARRRDLKTQTALRPVSPLLDQSPQNWTTVRRSRRPPAVSGSQRPQRPQRQQTLDTA